MATDAQREGVREALGSDDGTVRDRIRAGNEAILDRAQRALEAEAEELGTTVDALRARTAERAYVASSSSRVHSGGMGNGMPGSWRYSDWLTRLYPAGIPRRESDTPSSG